MRLVNFSIKIHLLLDDFIASQQLGFNFLNVMTSNYCSSLFNFWYYP